LLMRVLKNKKGMVDPKEMHNKRVANLAQVSSCSINRRFWFRASA
jgi:hypothetical protein